MWISEYTIYPFFFRIRHTGQEERKQNTPGRNQTVFWQGLPSRTCYSKLFQFHLFNLYATQYLNLSTSVLSSPSGRGTEHFGCLPTSFTIIWKCWHKGNNLSQRNTTALLKLLKEIIFLLIQLTLSAAPPQFTGYLSKTHTHLSSGTFLKSFCMQIK